MIGLNICGMEEMRNNAITSHPDRINCKRATQKKHENTSEIYSLVHVFVTCITRPASLLFSVVFVQHAISNF